MKKIAVLGTGNIAQTVAVDLKSNGHEVRLFAPDYLISRIQKTKLNVSVYLKQKKKLMSLLPILTKR